MDNIVFLSHSVPRSSSEARQIHVEMNGGAIFCSIRSWWMMQLLQVLCFSASFLFTLVPISHVSASLFLFMLRSTLKYRPTSTLLRSYERISLLVLQNKPLITKRWSISLHRAWASGFLAEPTLSVHLQTNKALWVWKVFIIGLIGSFMIRSTDCCIVIFDWSPTSVRVYF